MFSQYNCSIQILLRSSLLLLIIRYSHTGYNIPPPLIKENEVRSFLMFTLFSFLILLDRIQLHIYVYNLYFTIYFIYKLIFLFPSPVNKKNEGAQFSFSP